jgi:hypothetical protein
MKKLLYCGYALLTMALSIAVVSGAEPAASKEGSGGAGRLVIRRIANLGTDIVLIVTIDGKQAGTVVDGQDYDNPLPAGEHTVVVASELTTRTDVPPPQRKITVVAGETYAYTAKWKGDNLILE